MRARDTKQSLVIGNGRASREARTMVPTVALMAGIAGGTWLYLRNRSEANRLIALAPGMVKRTAERTARKTAHVISKQASQKAVYAKEFRDALLRAAQHPERVARKNPGAFTKTLMTLVTTMAAVILKRVATRAVDGYLRSSSPALARTP